MKQIVTTRNGGVEVLRVEEAPDPIPQRGEVVVRVRAAGLNFADILARQGLYPDAPKKPCVMGYEISGIVEETGQGVDKNLVGKAVAALTRFRGQAELVAVKADQTFSKPESLTFEQAAAIPVNYLTAYALLVVMGSLNEDESAITHQAGRSCSSRHCKVGAITYGTAVRQTQFLRTRSLTMQLTIALRTGPVLKKF